MTVMSPEILVGLDIGTTKICVVVAEVNEGELNFIGLGTHPSSGLRKGMVIDVESTVNAIRKAVKEAELMAGCQIDEALIGVAGSHIKCHSSNGVIKINSGEITEDHVNQVIESASAVAIPQDRIVLETQPQEYIVDDQGGILDPVGMTGVRLEVKVNVVTASKTAVTNLTRCAQKAGLTVIDTILQPLASSKAVLSQEECELGVALLDIGGGTTDLTIFNQGVISYTSVLPLGGYNMTNDIAIGLRTPMREAENLKIRYGACLESLVNKDEYIEVASVGGRKSRRLSRQILTAILGPRVEEMLSIINDEIQEQGFKDSLSCGVVLTGGAVLLPGLLEMADQIFDMPCRIGIPSGIKGLVDMVSRPEYSTAVGLVMYGYERYLDLYSAEAQRHGGILKRLSKIMKNVFGS